MVRDMRRAILAGLCGGLAACSVSGTAYRGGTAGATTGTSAGGGTPAATTGTATGSGATSGSSSGGSSSGGSSSGGSSSGGSSSGGDCIPVLGQSFPPLPDAGAVVDAGPPIACLPDGGAPITDVDGALAALSPDSWLDLPCTAMANACPQPYDHYLCGAVMYAWSGGAYDTLRDRLIVFGGGHSDSYYDEVFTFDLATATWRNWNQLPSGMNGSSVAAIYQDKRVETCGLYPSVGALCIPSEWLTSTGYLEPAKCDDPTIVQQLDPQRPRSRHSYGTLAFSTATGRFYSLGAPGLYPSGQSASARVDEFDFDAGLWLRGANNPDVGYAVSAADGRGNLWYVNDNLDRYDPVADSWTVYPGEGQDFKSGALYGYYAAADVDTTRNVLVLTSDGQQLETYALGDGGLTVVQASGLSAPLPSEAGMAYDPVLDRFVWWNGGPTLYFLNPATWTWTAVQGQGADPGGPSSNGTFGRFRYSPNRNVFVAVSSTESDVFVYKPPATAP